VVVAKVGVAALVPSNYNRWKLQCCHTLRMSE